MGAAKTEHGNSCAPGPARRRPPYKLQTAAALLARAAVVRARASFCRARGRVRTVRGEARRAAGDASLRLTCGVRSLGVAERCG